MLNIITCPITMEIMREPVIGDDSQKGLGEILNNLTTEQQSFIFIH